MEGALVEDAENRGNNGKGKEFLNSAYSIHSMDWVGESFWSHEASLISFSVRILPLQKCRLGNRMSGYPKKGKQGRNQSKTT